MQFSRARVGYKAPDEIIVLEQMPINATGKVDRVALKQLADSQGAVSKQGSSAQANLDADLPL